MTKKITIVGFGDSITEAVIEMPDENKRWLNILDANLKETFPEYSFNVINSGVGGNSARQAMERFETDVLAHDPDFVLLEFGGNNEKPLLEGQRVSYEEFSSLLEKYKNGVPAKTKTIVITFPPILEGQHAYYTNLEIKECLKQFGGAGVSLEKYRNITKEFSRDNTFPLYDLNKELVELGEKNGSDKYTLPDGVHLTAEANIVFADGVFGILKELIEKGDNNG